MHRGVAGQRNAIDAKADLVTRAANILLGDQTAHRGIAIAQELVNDAGRDEGRKPPAIQFKGLAGLRPYAATQTRSLIDLNRQTDAVGAAYGRRVATRRPICSAS